MSAALAPRPLSQTRTDALELIATGLQSMAQGVRLYGELLDRQPTHGAQLLTIEDAATRLACSPDHVRQRCRTGQIKFMRDGRLYRIAEADLEAYRRRRTR